MPVSREEILSDYRIGYRSRQASLIGRREVLTGKAKFGIFGDGKEVPQLAMARAFKPGDIRSGYYRDQTFMFAAGMLTVQQFFAQLYADISVEAEPSSAGRSMNGHYATRSLDENGEWKDMTAMRNSSADVSPTASQMPRLVGLGYASVLYRNLEELAGQTKFSKKGNEVAFGTIGNASSAEGMFWESVNAIGVLGGPTVLSIWDDGYGISVPNDYQIARGDLSKLLSGFQRAEGEKQGFDLYTVKGWDYAALVDVYAKAAERARAEHVPAIIHVIEVTQPQGHSTSGSHERYKSKERLEWESEFDCLLKMREWMIAEGVATKEEMDALEQEETQAAIDAKDAALEAFLAPIRTDVAEASALMRKVASGSKSGQAIEDVLKELESIRDPGRKDPVVAAARVLYLVRDEAIPAAGELAEWRNSYNAKMVEEYGSHLYTPVGSPLDVPEVAPVYADDAQSLNGSQIINACFDALLARDPRVMVFGEDVGKLGDVNQGCVGLQAKYGEMRVGDTGIRECTIVGQAIGLAMRGLRPIAEVQYLDYLLYALQLMSDDLSTVQYRTKGGQRAPVIVRTRGHRLEGIWHSGSPMAGIINLVRGMHVLVPRDMTRAAGFYNTLMQGEDPALIVEVLNGYRLKEKLPSNIGEYTLPLGVPDVMREGEHLTIVTYGACCRIVMEAAEMLAGTGIEVEVIDVQSLLPFDLHGRIVESIRKTGRVLFVDEDVPGGTTAYMMREVLERQGGWKLLDSAPKTLAAKEHRPPYGSDGNYWAKPSLEEIFETAYEIMNESNPNRYPIYYR